MKQSEFNEIVKNLPDPGSYPCEVYQVGVTEDLSLVFTKRRYELFELGVLHIWELKGTMFNNK
jgi:hypothetical protein